MPNPMARRQITRGDPMAVDRTASRDKVMILCGGELVPATREHHLFHFVCSKCGHLIRWVVIDEPAK